MANRDASRARGQAVKTSKYTKNSIGESKSAGTSDHRGHTKSPVTRTIATRKPKHWGKS